MSDDHFVRSVRHVLSDLYGMRTTSYPASGYIGWAILRLLILIQHSLISYISPPLKTKLNKPKTDISKMVQLSTLLVLAVSSLAVTSKPVAIGSTPSAKLTLGTNAERIAQGMSPLPPTKRSSGMFPIFIFILDLG